MSYTSLLLLRQILLFLMPGTRYCHSVLVAFEKLFKRRSGLDIRKYVFGNRVSDKWNNLPQCCINCTTLNNFKSHIHKVLEPETE